MIDLPTKAEVYCLDGSAARSTYVIGNPINNEIMHLVVQSNRPPFQEYLVTGVNHANAFFDGIMGARNFYRLVLDTKFPFIRLIKAIQDIHERRFASAIFTQESVNFTSFQGKN